MNGIQIVGWNETFESASSRKLQNMKWFPAPAGIQSQGVLTLLLKYGTEGITALGVFQLICQFHATNRDIDGRLMGIISHGSAKVLPISLLAGLLRIPSDVLERSLEILCAEDVAWLREISGGEVGEKSHGNPVSRIGISIGINDSSKDRGSGGKDGDELELEVDSPPEIDPLLHYRDKWNEITADVLPACREINSDRRKLLRAKEKADPKFREKWEKAIRNLITSPHHIGGSDSGWKADFDFMLQTRKDRVLQMLEFVKPAPKPNGRALADWSNETGGIMNP